MTIHWDKVLPVFVSIGILIAVAILRQYSRTVAAIAATMPINIPLGMWIVYAGAEDPQAALRDFSQAVLINIVPTIGFMLMAWWMTRTGGGLVPALAAGYAVWAVGLALIFLVRQVIG